MDMNISEDETALWNHLIKVTPSRIHKRKYITFVNSGNISKTVKSERIVVESENEIFVNNQDEWMKMENNLYNDEKDFIWIRRFSWFKEND